MKLGRVGKQGLRGGISLYVGQVLGLFNKLVLFPMAFLGAEEYWGLFEWFSSTAVLVVALGSLGVSRTWVRFAPAARTDRAALLKWSTAPAALGFLGMMLALWVFAPALSNLSSNPELSREHYFAFALILASLWLFDVAGGILQADFKAHWPLFANNVSLRLLNTAVLGSAFALRWSPGLLIAALAGVLLLNHGFLAILAARRLKQNVISPERSNPDPATPRLWNDYRRYSLWTVLAAHAMLQLDVFLVGSLLPLSQAALLGLSKNFTSAVEMPARSISQASMAVLAERMSAGDLSSVRSIYRKTSLVQFLASGLLFFFLLINLRWMLGLLPEGKGYETVWILVAVAGIGRLVDALTGSNTVIINNSDFYRFNLWSSILSLGLMVGIQLWSIPRFGLVGASIGFALALSVVNASKTLYLFIKTGLHPFDRAHIELLILFALLASIFAFIRPQMEAGPVFAANLLGLLVCGVYLGLRRSFWKGLISG